MKKTLFVLVAALASGTASAQLTLTPLTSFGGGDGWFAPGEGGYPFLSTLNLDRGLAYGNNHLYLVSRANVGGNALNIRILDKNTGADLGGLDVGSGIVSGGAFAINTVRVAGDGAIYVANLASPVNPSPFKVYRWASEATTPTVAFNSTTVTGGRLGDNFDVVGSGSATRLVAGESHTSGTGWRNGYAVFSTLDGLNYTDSLVIFAPNPNPVTGSGDFRLGITFTDADHVIGAQGGSASTMAPRYTTYAGTVGTLLGSPYLTGSQNQTIMDYAELGGLPLLATQATDDSTVRISDLSNLAFPTLLATGNNTSGPLVSNSNRAGQMAWGDVTAHGDGSWSATLWTMSANQGIQAFQVTVPEPGSLALAGLGLIALLAARRHRLRR